MIHLNFRLINKSLKYSFLCCLLLLASTAVAQTSEQPLFTFGVIADVQYADRDNHNTRHYRGSLKKFSDAIEVFNNQKVDFVISLGDFINDDYRSFDTLGKISRQLKAHLYQVIGNHDYEVEDKDKAKVLKALKLKRSYYSFKRSHWKFIVLNGLDISLMGNRKGSSKYKKAEEIFNKLKAEGAPGAKPWNGTLDEKQITWMKEEIRKAEKKKQKVIILCHYPLYPDHSPQILWNVSEIRNAIEGRDNVVAYFNGHVHVSQYFFNNGVNYVSFKGMVEKDDNAFAIVTVYKNRLEIKGYGAEIDRILKVTPK